MNPPAPTAFKPLNSPHVTWGEFLGIPECPYVRRWVVNFGFVSFRLHHWFKSDDARYLHDHPWWFLTVVLRGGYTDVGDTTRDHLSARSVRFRPALHRHYVDVDPGGCWTFLITGKKIRSYGFWVNGKFEGVRKYFRHFGHPPCDEE